MNRGLLVKDAAGVGMNALSNLLFVNLEMILVFPTPVSPIKTTLQFSALLIESDAYLI